MQRYVRHVDRFIAVLSHGWEIECLRRFDLAPAALSALVEEAGRELAPLLDEYGRQVSPPDMAISLRSASLLAALCRLMRPRRILDTGSGFSSYVVRRYAPAGPPAGIWSVDDDERWLEQTRSFLKRHGVPDANLVSWDRFAGSGERDFDLIFHDLGRAESIRVQVLPDVCRRLARRGMILLDDFHKPRYRAAARRILAAAGLAHVPLRHHTIDGFGRFAALACKAA